MKVNWWPSGERFVVKRKKKPAEGSTATVEVQLNVKNYKEPIAINLKMQMEHFTTVVMSFPLVLSLLPHSLENLAVLIFMVIIIGSQRPLQNKQTSFM